MACTLLMSTGFSASERGNVRLGDAVVVFARRPIGLCAAARSEDVRRFARHRRRQRAGEARDGQASGPDVVLDYEQQDVVGEIEKLTGGGADVAIEAPGRQGTFEGALRSVGAGGTVSSLGVYSGHLAIRWMRLPRASATTPSSRRSVRATRSACVAS